MNKSILNFIFTIIIAIILSLFTPWWSVMIAGFITAFLFPLKKTAIFLIPFLAIFAFWSVYAFYIGNSNDFILAKRIAILLPLGGNPYVLILVTGIVGGIASGVSAILGKQIQLIGK